MNVERWVLLYRRLALRDVGQDPDRGEALFRRCLERRAAIERGEVVHEVERWVLLYRVRLALQYGGTVR